MIQVIQGLHIPESFQQRIRLQHLATILLTESVSNGEQAQLQEMLHDRKQAKPLAIHLQPRLPMYITLPACFSTSVTWQHAVVHARWPRKNQLQYTAYTLAGEGLTVGRSRKG